MAVAPATPDLPQRPARVKDYWRKFHRTTQIVAAVIVVAALLGTTLVLLALDISPISSQGIVLLLTSGSTTIMGSIVLIRRLTTPHHDVIAALTSVSGEETAVVPPNPNRESYQKTGLTPVLQLIYSLASGDRTATAETAAKPELDTALAAAFNTTAAGIVTLDHNRQVSFYNRAAPIITNAANRPELELLFDDTPDLFGWLDQCEQGAIHAERTWQRVATKVTGEEGRRIFDISASYDRDSVHEVVLVMIDRSATYVPEDEDLDFISFAAHELRGPITVIRGYLDVLMQELPNLTPDQTELFKRLIVSANRLSSYVNNILNASKFDRRHLRLHLSEDRLSDIYATIADDMQMRASSQNRLLAVDIPSNLPTVAADRASISEVISNLIDNAIKYSHDGGTVAVTATQDGEFVTVSVSDQGIGIPSNVMSNLFHKFYRSHRSRETVSGTGIGLYICKAIIESHGGRIGVKSNEGQGSTFSFALPIYATVADKLTDGDNANLIATHSGWIRNHTRMEG